MSHQIDILHVDDEPSFTDLTATFLERDGDRFAVETATSADEGIQVVTDRPPDCVVSDYNMPGMDGLEFLQAVRTDHPDLPFILFTGKGSEAVASEAISAGVTDYIQKESGSHQFDLLANRIERTVDRYRTEQELDRQKELFAKAQRIATIGAWAHDLDSDTLLWTDEVYEMHGVSESFDPSIENILELYHPEDRPKLQEAVERATTAGEPYDLEVRMTARDDGTRRFRTVADPRIEDGEVVRVRGIVHDITDQRERERQLRELNRATQSLLTAETRQEVADLAVAAAKEVLGLEANGIHFAEADSTRLVAAAQTDEAAALTGETRALPVSDSIAGRIYRDGEPAIVEDVREDRDVYNAETDLKGHYYLPLADHGVLIAGSEEPAAFDTQQLAFGELLAGNLVAALDRVERETQLNRERKRYATFFEVLPNPILHAEIEDEEPVVQAVNPAFAETFGYDTETIRGEPLHEYILPDSRTEAITELNERILEEDQVRTEVQRETAKGVRTFRLNVRTRSAEDGTTEGYAVYTDITDREEYERELEAQNERLEEFASIISHDLRNPLNVAQGYLELEEDVRESDHLARATDAIDRSQALIDDLLTLAREGREVAEVEPVDLSDVAEHSWQTADTGTATLEVDAPQVIEADRSRLTQLLENLFRNAVEHGSNPRSGTREDGVGQSTPGSGPAAQNTVEHDGEALTVSVGTMDGGFYVADDGPGVPEDEREDVFEAGYSTTTGGTGFGLRIVEQVVDAHGWAVGVTDSETGGARFEITGVDTVDR